MNMKNVSEREGTVRNASNSESAWPDSISKAISVGLQTAVLTAFAGGCGTEEPNEPLLPPDVLEQSTGALTISDLNPPPAPLVLPLPNGAAPRISQKAEGAFSHFRNSTLHGVDYSIGGQAKTPLAGTLHFKSGNCVANDNICRANHGCNEGWGNLVELDGVDGNTYIFGHCFAFQPGLNDGDFVGEGTTVCQIGCSGNSTGIHLHFDRVTRNGGVSYTSQGVPAYLIYTAGNTTPTIQTPDTYTTCCNDAQCDARPGTPQCTTYTSLNHNTLDSLSTFARSLLANQNVVSVNGGFRLYQDYRAADFSLYTQDADVMINGARTHTQILFQVGDFFGTGSRNPLLETADSYFYDSQANQWHYMTEHTDVRSESFINYDLWDYTRSYLQGANRDAVQIPQNVNHTPNWTPDWELHSAQFNINGTAITPYLAVSRASRGMRFATHLENNQWRPWTAL